MSENKINYKCKYYPVFHKGVSVGYTLAFEDRHYFVGIENLFRSLGFNSVFSVVFLHKKMKNS